MLSRRNGALGSLVIALTLSLGGCEDKPKSSASAEASASADGGPAKPVMDSRIAKAVESAAAQPGGSGTPADGPPPNGVFGPGGADKVHPPGSPRKVELLAEGSAPRVSIGAGPGAKWPKSLSITVGQRIGPQAMPTLVYELGLKIAKPEEGDEAAGGQPTTIVVTVQSVDLAPTQPGAVPKELHKEVAKLKGGTIRGILAPDGGVNGAELHLPKGGNEGLRGVLEALANAMDHVWLPTPGKPVGAGGYWMVTDRARPAGVPVVRYRVYRVTAVEDQQATISLDVRQYSVGGVVDIPGLDQGLVLTAASFSSAGKGNVVASAGRAVPELVELGMPLQLQLQAKERPDQPMLLQAEMALRLAPAQPPPADAATADPTAAPAPQPAPAPAPNPPPSD